MPFFAGPEGDEVDSGFRHLRIHPDAGVRRGACRAFALAERVVGVVDHAAQGWFFGFVHARIPLVAPNRGFTARGEKPASKQAQRESSELPGGERGHETGMLAVSSGVRHSEAVDDPAMQPA